MTAPLAFKFYLAALFCPCLLAVALPFSTRRGFKFYFASHRPFDMLWLCLLGTPRVRDVASVGTMRQRARSFGIGTHNQATMRLLYIGCLHFDDARGTAAFA
ncbi:hypothetical protein [Campylobacter gracilis]|uniref:Uncharacterized protein n=1 Tax=Campylobacter gracilis RM3268 TaxID=553220 RepID=C8PGT2_9BACT|nr:hypothetical protein [Campylobacter gracilis]EEV18320.1 hypothetical protein CAMGR0001_1077 [Campylobacter gracilis RM3268]